MMDEEMEMLRAIENFEHQEDAGGPPRHTHKYRDCFNELSDRMFKKKFRLTKQLARDLINTVSPFVEPRTHKSAMTVEEMVSKKRYMYCKVTLIVKIFL